MSRREPAGFTLIEMLVVLAVLALLVGIVAPQLLSRAQDADVKAAQAQIGALKTALELYIMDNGEPPTTEQGLPALIAEPTTAPQPRNWRPYLKDMPAVPRDPWGNEYVYQSPGPEGQEYYIVSYGADGRPGGSGYDADIDSMPGQL